MSISDSSSGSSLGSPRQSSTGFPRTGNFGDNHFGDYSDEEEINDTFRVGSQTPSCLTNVIEMYENRQQGSPFQAFDESIVENSAPELMPMLPEGVTVHMSNVAVLCPEKRTNRQYLHSWENLAKVNSTEAQRALKSFFVCKYYETAKWTEKNPKSSVEINFDQSLRQYHIQGMAQNMIRVFHYVGLGFPAPKDGKICIKEDGFGPDNWKSMNDIKNAQQSNILFIFDCNQAESLREPIMALSPSDRIFQVQTFNAFFACGKNDVLHIPETLPQNIFSCTLLDPLKSIRALTPDIVGVDDGTLKMLVSIFTESIALDSLDQKTFSTHFHDPPLISNLWKHFILAQRLMKNFGIMCHSIPELPDCSEHPLWQQFEYSIRCSNSKQFNSLIELYQNHFLTVESPTRIVRSFIASLLKNDNMYEQIIPKIAEFMLRSPMNCCRMVEFLDPLFITTHRITQERSIEGARAWNIVISGILLAQPGNSKWVAFCLEAGEVMNLVHSPNTDDICRKYLLSTIIALSDGMTHFTGLIGNEDNVSGFLEFIFDKRTSSETRLFYAVLILTMLGRTQSKPTKVGESGIPIIAKMLIDDQNVLTRSMAIGILGLAMHPKFPQYNKDLLKIALPAAIDGSYRVRLVFIAMIQRYIELGNEIGRDSPISLDILINRETEDPTQLLGEIIGFLANDPSDEVHQEALLIPSNTKPDFSAEEHLKAVCETIHHTAHSSLFASAKSNVKRVQRYPDSVLKDGGLELFEILPAHDNSGAVSALAFDLNHISVAYGSVSGTLVWGEDQWRACSSAVTDIAFMGGGCLAAGSSSGSIYIMKRGYSKPVDSFQPSLIRNGLATLIAPVENTSNALICTGNVEVVLWDIAALKPIKAIELPQIVLSCKCFNNEFVASLWDGRVISYDIRDFSVINEIPAQRGRNIIRIGKHQNLFYTAAESGPAIFYDQGKVVRTTEQWSRASDVLLHPTLNAGIIIGGETKLVDINCKKVDTMATSARGNRCCFDGDRQLAAIGNDDGTVAIWRIPTLY